MATTKYTDGGVSPRTTLYAEREMLKHAAPVMVLDKFATTKQMPKNKTQVISFRRPNTFTAATSPLVEGVTPGSTQFTYTTISATLRQYGEVIEVTDHIEDTHEDPVLNDISRQAGENIGRTVEALTYAVVKAGTNVYYTNGTARNVVNTPISLAKIRAVVRGLMAQKAMMVTSVLSPSVNYGTSAVEGAFIGIVHTDLENDIRNLAGFLPAAAYGQRKLVHERELGSVENVRFISSPDLAPFLDAGGAKAGASGTCVSTSGTSADVYPVIITGKDAYATIALRGMGAVEPSIIPVGQKTKDDPLGQRGYCGWKTWHAAVITNDSWIARLECGALAL